VTAFGDVPWRGSKRQKSGYWGPRPKAFGKVIGESFAVGFMNADLTPRIQSEEMKKSPQPRSNTDALARA
jgi:hypothetical protein